MVYGIPYLGSKSGIAEDIITNLPKGNRLVDLFGGGFAISHCALLSYKWKKVLYNDINPLLVPLLTKAMDGGFSYSRFTPEWISRDEFQERKNSDGYVKWCWSFGNDGDTYLYGKDVEDIKRQAHEFCVNGTPIPEINLDARQYETVSARRIALKNYCALLNNDYQILVKLEHLERLERLQHLERLERRDRLEMTCMDYREYKYQEGDVVYCDIPYQNNSGKKDYGGGFRFGDFYEWAISQPYPVYFSSYKLGGIVWEQDKTVTKAANANDLTRREVLYCADNDFPDREIVYQGNLFTQII